MKYLSIEDYQSSIFCLNSDKEDIEKYISLAEQDLDIILFIPNDKNLTDRQLEIIKRVLVQHTDFIIENYDYLYSIVDNYKTLDSDFSIGSKNCISINGVFMLKKLYVLLLQTGLGSNKI